MNASYKTHLVFFVFIRLYSHRCYCNNCSVFYWEAGPCFPKVQIWQIKVGLMYRNETVAVCECGRVGVWVYIHMGGGERSTNKDSLNPFAQAGEYLPVFRTLTRNHKSKECTEGRVRASLQSLYIMKGRSRFLMPSPM